ncbi:hypothetical protein SPF06_21765 [Sinomonas sp. JGH33]|uniref:ABC transporter permease n=1 Tax=Sinomonas terricola TaxID=3110330 RepID=A0ABU5TCF0_9MICC|nr:hypothetical protein [Sinomonas sp. JGH33]MEA5457351.1 hypothetical protein [Sinomonas sp. JGH33]
MATRSAVWGEAFATMRSTPVASIATAAAAFLLGFLGIFASFEDLQRIVTAWDRQIAAGSTVLTVASSSPEGLPAARCEQLNELDSVVAAGGRSASSSVTSALLPSRRFTIDLTTPHYARVVWPGLDKGANPSVVASSTVAQELGLGAGSGVAVQGVASPYEVSAVAAAAPRLPQLQNSLVVAEATSSRVEACLVEAVPSAVTDVEALLTGWFSGPDPVAVLRLVPPKDADQDPQSELTRRIGVAVPVGAGAGAAALACVLLWARRGDFASYRLAGASRREIFELFLIEFAHLYAVPLAAGATAQLALRSPGLGASAVVGQALLIDIAALLATASVAVPLAKAYLDRLDPIRTLKGE